MEGSSRDELAASGHLKGGSRRGRSGSSRRARRESPSEECDHRADPFYGSEREAPGICLTLSAAAASVSNRRTACSATLGTGISTLRALAYSNFQIVSREPAARSSKRPNPTRCFSLVGVEPSSASNCVPIVSACSTPAIPLRIAGAVDSAGKTVGDPEARRLVGARAVANSLKVLRHLCRFATLYRTSNGRFLLEADPTRGLEIPEESNPKRPRTDADRCAKLLAVAPRVRMATTAGERVASYLPQLLPLAYHTGRRISAVLALRWSDWRAAEKPYGALFWCAAHDKLGRDWLTPVRPEVRACLEAFQREQLGLGDALILPTATDPRRPVDHHLAAAWLRQAEKLAGLEPLQGGAWHPFRRAWATARKGLSLKDVAEAGGWKDTTTLLECYAQADPETIAAVVMHDAPARAVR